MEKRLKVWFDLEGDMLEIGFAKRKGFMKDIGEDMFIRLDQKGEVIGFTILNATKRFEKVKELKLPIKGKLVSLAK